MSNRFKRAVIDEVTSRNIDASLQDCSICSSRP